MKYVPFLVLLLAGPAQAQCYSSSYRSSYYTPYYAPYYPPVTKIIEKYIPVAIPVYSATYTPGVAVAPAVAAPAPAVAAQAVAPAQAKPAMPAASLDNRLLQALDRFDRRMTLIEQRLGIQPPSVGGAQPPTMPPAGVGAGQQDVSALMGRLVSAKCAKCHSDTTGAKGGLALVRGGQIIDPATLTPNQKLGMLQRCYTQDPKIVMPPPSEKNPLTDQEVGLVHAWVGGRKQ